MSIMKSITKPFRKMLDSIRTANQQTYCGDSETCDSLHYSKGKNLNQDIPVRKQVWDKCPVPDETGIPRDAEEPAAEKTN